MVKTPKNNFEIAADFLLKEAGARVEIGEYEYVSTAVRVLYPLIASWLKAAGMKPVTEKAIANWFYQEKPPAWAAAFVVERATQAAIKSGKSLEVKIFAQAS